MLTSKNYRIWKLCCIPMLHTFPLLVIGIPIITILSDLLTETVFYWIKQTDTILLKYKLWDQVTSLLPYRSAMSNLLRGLKFFAEPEKLYMKINSLRQTVCVVLGTACTINIHIDMYFYRLCDYVFFLHSMGDVQKLKIKNKKPIYMYINSAVFSTTSDQFELHVLYFNSEREINLC